jgi:phosphoglycerate dehydrogenase-like enzyme
MRIYVHDVLREGEREMLRASCPEDDCWFAGQTSSEGERREALAASEIAFGYCPHDWLREAPRLQWMQLPGVGFDQYLPLAQGGQPPFLMTNLRGVFKDCVAESCLAGVLAFNRGIKRLSERQVARSWEKDAIRPQLRTVRGSRVLVLGTGAIGRQFGALMAGLGAEVTFFGRSCPPADISGTQALDSALPRMQVVAAFLPDTAETRDLFGRERIGLLNKEAVFVNAGRGSLVDEAALVTALDAEQFRGAVLDVTREEPLPLSSALWSNGKVLLTQHTAGGHRDELRIAIEHFVGNRARFKNGQQLVNLVDWRKGY